MTQTQDERSNPLSGAWFAWAWVLPQAVLAWLNVRAWQLVCGDLTDTQRMLALRVGAWEAVLLLCGVAGMTWWFVRRRSIGLWQALGTLGLHVGYLWFFFAHIGRIMPASVTLWMLPETEIIFYQFSLIMPIVFLMLVRLARVDTGLSRGADLGLAIGLLVGIPTGTYILGLALARLMRECSLPWDGFQHVFTTGLIVGTAVVLTAFLKLLIKLYDVMARQRWSGWVLPLVAGLAAPLAGLALNAGIPFPYDFQDATVYALTLLNGAALLIPFRLERRWAIGGWAARVMLFPFSLYFFLVFLPFLPLSLLAMIVAGSGVLILAPVLLLVVHGRLLAEQGRWLAGRYGVGRMVSLGALCLLVLPATFLWRCDGDRRTLGQAVDAVFSPDYRATTIAFHPPRLRRALAHMDDVKQGIFLPYLTDIYNAWVFRGLVLPDAKADLIRQSLLGEEPVREKTQPTVWGRGFLGGQPRGRRLSRGAGVTHDVVMAKPIVACQATNDVMTTTVTLPLENRGGDNGEFSALLTVPAGVLVTGFWLDVNGTNKPAQLRERKTALWVYEMIRDMTRCDPGLLLYESDTRLRLRVYPFARDQRRACGITFRFPATLHPTIRIQDTPVALHTSAPPEQAIATVVALDSGMACIAPAVALNGWPAFSRPFMAHLILDRSAAAAASEGEVVQRAKAAIAALPPSVSAIRLTWANYEQADASNGPHSREAALTALDRPVALPCRGGFCPERVIARSLLEARAGLERALPPPGGSAPLFLAITAPGSVPVQTDALAALARSAPDMPAYLIGATNTWRTIAFSGVNTGIVTLAEVAPKPIVAVRKGNTVELIPASSAGEWIFAVRDASEGEWECWNPTQQTYRAIAPLARCTDPTYVAGLQLWARHRALGWAPQDLDAALPGLVAEAQAWGVAIPETAWVVVETSAQETMLARKEKQALSADHALEFDDVKRATAPSALWLLPVVLFGLYRLRRGSKA